MPWENNGVESLPQLPDGDPADVVKVNGVVVAKAVVIVDDYESDSVEDDYGYLDTGQSNLPTATSSAAYEGSYGLAHDGSKHGTQATASLASGNPGYNSSKQSQTLENYPGPNNILEFYFRPVDFDSPAQWRFSFNLEAYDNKPGLRLPFDYTGYWRIEEVDSGGNSSYYGTDPQEESFTWTIGDWHRVVIDQTIWPDVSTHLWNADTGSHISSLETSGGSGTWNNDGFGYWGNDETHVQFDYLNLIDSDDYTANADL